jgi:hypothetical protein
MPIWMNPSIAQMPDCTLVSWAVFEVQLGRDAEVTRHVAGEIGYGGEGQVSSPVLEFEASTASFRTRSGRLYRVQGPLGLGAEADYVWRRWCAIWPSAFDPRDVSAQVALAIARAKGFESYREFLAANRRGKARMRAP